jgi:uncharacterized repeat protein (TIGR03803 family)
MKVHFKSLFPLASLLACLGLIPIQTATAQGFTNLHHFAGAPDDGNAPSSGIVSSGGRLYGTTALGGSSGAGTVFSLNRDGTGFTNLHSFAPSEGNGPNALVISTGIVYGTASFGGAADSGTVFKLNTNGTGVAVLHHFEAFADAPDVFNSPTNREGATPTGLILAGDTLYGAALSAGSSGSGTLFKLNTSGTGFTVLHSFAARSSSPPSTNGEGANPAGSLLLSGETLFGVAGAGGIAGNGTVFAVNTDGTGFTNLHSFTAVLNNTNSDGTRLDSKLVLAGSTLFGTATAGGLTGYGTVFAVNTDGTDFRILHHFSKPPGLPFSTINSDGVSPLRGLLVSGNTLFGKTANGGGMGWGTLFAINIDGTGFTTLFSFAEPSPSNTNSTGFNAFGDLLFSGNTLYGTANSGGSLGFGTVFGLTLPAPPALTGVRSEAKIVLSWPTNAGGLLFTLQSTTNLASSAVWSTASPPPVDANGQHSVTNPVSGPRKFYRLTQ